MMSSQENRFRKQLEGQGSFEVLEAGQHKKHLSRHPQRGITTSKLLLSIECKSNFLRHFFLFHVELCATNEAIIRRIVTMSLDSTLRQVITLRVQNERKSSPSNCRFLTLFYRFQMFK